MLKKKLLYISIAFVFIGVLFLLVRENEGRTAAEEKVKDLQYKIDTLSNQKEGVITDLQTEMTQLEDRLKEWEQKYNALNEEKDTEITNLVTKSQEDAVKHEASVKAGEEEIGRLESRSREESDKFSILLKEKNTEINDLSLRLQDSSVKISDLLKKIESLEVKNLSCERSSGELETSLKKAEQRGDRLAELIKDFQEQKISD